MSDNKVVSLPASDTFNEEQALMSALDYHREHGLQDVVIVAYDMDGVFFTRSSRMTRKDALWLAEMFRQYALGELA